MTGALNVVDPGIFFKVLGEVLETRPFLDNLECVSVNYILFKAINKLSVLQNVLPYPHLSFNHSYESMPFRMTKLIKVTPPEDKEPEETLALKNIQKCRHFAQNVLGETSYELAIQGTYHFLEFTIQCESLRKYDNIYLRYEFDQINNYIYNLKQKIISVRQTFNKVLPYLSYLSGPCLEQAALNKIMEAELIKIYTEAKVKVKTDQNKYRIQHKERCVQRELKSTLANIDDDHIVTFEIKNLIISMTSKLQKKLDKWTKKYNEEMETLDVTLLQTESKLDDQREKYNNLLEIYLERKEILEKLQEEADARDKMMEVKRKKSKAALKIQMWWRNVLFKRFLQKKTIYKKLKLQPYKKTKQKKKTKKKK